MSAQPFHNDFRRTREASHRINVARIDEQRRCHELVKRAPSGTTDRNWSKVTRQSPARVKRHAVRRDRLLSKQSLKSGERRINMHLINNIDKRRDGALRDNLVGVAQAKLIRDGSAPVSCDYIRMRLIENVRVRGARTHARKQLEIRGEATPAAQNRAIVFDLSRDEDEASIHLRAVKLSTRAFILG
jgi:hypothetical protein